MTRNNRQKNSKIEHPKALQSTRKSIFGGLRLALPGLNSTTTTITSQQVAIVSTKSSTIVNHDSIENVSVNESSSWARWPQADKRSVVATDENANSTRKKLVPKMIKASSPRKRSSASNNNIDNSRYILAVNQGRSFASNTIDPQERTLSLQKRAMEASAIVDRSSDTMTKQEYKKPQQQLEENPNVQDKPTRSPLTTYSKPLLNNMLLQDVELTDCPSPHLAERKLTEYEYYLQRSANGGRLGIEERIDVFEPQITSQQQKFDDLESIHKRHGRHAYEDDDTTTVMTTLTASNKVTSSISIISQSPSKSNGVLDSRHNRNCDIPFVAENYTSSQLPTEELIYSPQQQTDTFNEFAQFMEYEVSLENYPKKQKTENVELHNEQQIKSQVNRLIELKNSAEFLNEISSQVKNDQHMRRSNITKSKTATVVEPILFEAINKVNVTEDIVSMPVTYTRQQEPTEAEDIDRLLAILGPIRRDMFHNSKLQQEITSTSMSMKSPPLHNSPRKQYPTNNPRQLNRELGSQYSGSSDGEFNEKLKAEAFAVFDDNNDEDIMIAKPCHKQKPNTFRFESVDDNFTEYTIKPTEESESEYSLNENQQQHIKDNLSNSYSGSSDNQEDDIVKQFFQTDLDKLDFEMMYEASLQEQGLHPLPAINVTQSNFSSAFGGNKSTANDPCSSDTFTIGKDCVRSIVIEKSPNLHPQTLHQHENASVTATYQKLQPSGNALMENDFVQLQWEDRKVPKQEGQNLNESLNIFITSSIPDTQHPSMVNQKVPPRQQPKLDESTNRFICASIPDSRPLHPESTSRENRLSHPSFAAVEKYHAVTERKGVVHGENELTRNFIQEIDNGADISMRKKQEELSIKDITKESSPQLGKQGYASAPIRKYWQQYSNVRSGGSFDTISLRNEGSDEYSMMDINIQQRSQSSHDQEENVAVASTNRLQSNKFANPISNHKHAILNADGLTELKPNFSNKLTNDEQPQDSMLTPLNEEYNGFMKSESVESKVNTLDQSSKKQNCENQGSCTTSGSIENRSDRFSTLDSHKSLPVAAFEAQQSSQYHVDEEHQLHMPQQIYPGQLYDDEGLCIHQRKSSFFEDILHVPVNSGSDLTHRSRSVAKPTIAIEVERSASNSQGPESPNNSDSCVQDNMNSPETEFLIFAKASQLATKELNSRVEKAISPTKEGTLTKAQESKWYSVTDDCLTDGNNIDDIVSMTPISRYKQYNRDVTRPVATQKFCTSDNIPKRNELSTSYHTRQQSHDLWPSTQKTVHEPDNSQGNQNKIERVNYPKIKEHSVAKRYPSFDSDIAIAEDVIEVLSVTSSEEIRGHDPTSPPSDNGKDFTNILRQFTIPILPPWHSENDKFSDSAPASHTSIQRLRISSDNGGQNTRRSGRPQPGALDTNESVYSKELPSPLRDTLIHAMSPMLSGDSHDEDTVSEWSSRYDQSRAGYSESFHQQCCSFFDCFDLATLEEQLRTICKHRRD